MLDLKLSNGTKIVFAVDISNGVPHKLFDEARKAIVANLSALTDFTAQIKNFDDRLSTVSPVINPSNINEVVENHPMKHGGGTDVNQVLESLDGDEEIVVFTDGFLQDYDKLKSVKERVTFVLVDTDAFLTSSHDQFAEHIECIGFKHFIRVK